MNGFLSRYNEIAKEDQQNSPLQGKPEKIKYLTRTAKGTVETLPKPKSQLYRTKAEGRNKQIMQTRAKKIKLTSSYWTSQHITGLFFNNRIIACKDENGWFIHLNKPHRKMNQADQIELLLQIKDTPHLVHYNMEHKHFIIESLEGND